jgi:hypothetical protein
MTWATWRSTNVNPRLCNSFYGKANVTRSHPPGQCLNAARHERRITDARSIRRPSSVSIKPHHSPEGAPFHQSLNPFIFDPFFSVSNQNPKRKAIMHLLLSVVGFCLTIANRSAAAASNTTVTANVGEDRRDSPKQALMLLMTSSTIYLMTSSTFSTS